MRTLFLILVALGLSTQSSADDSEKKGTPVQVFGATSKVMLITCQLNAQTALIEAEMGKITNPYSPMTKCVAETKIKIKPLFLEANAMVAKKPAVSNLLKDYYAAWLTALEGIGPEQDEIKVLYNKRQGDSTRRMNELWHRFEIETEL